MLVALDAGAVERFSDDFPRHRRLSDAPDRRQLDLGRSAAYGLFLMVVSALPSGRTCIAQAVLTIWLIVLALRAHGWGRRARLRGGRCAHSRHQPALVHRPIDAGHPVSRRGAGARSLLIFRTSRLARWERYALAACIAAIMSHMAAAPWRCAARGPLAADALCARGLAAGRLTAAGAVARASRSALSPMAITGRSPARRAALRCRSAACCRRHRTEISRPTIVPIRVAALRLQGPAPARRRRLVLGQRLLFGRLGRFAGLVAGDADHRRRQLTTIPPCRSKPRRAPPGN